MKKHRRHPWWPLLVVSALAAVLCTSMGAFALPRYLVPPPARPTPTATPRVPLPPAPGQEADGYDWDRANDAATYSARPTCPKATLKHEVFAYLPYWELSHTGSLCYNLLTTIAYSGLNVTASGALDHGDPGWRAWQNDDVLNGVLATAHRRGVHVVLTFTCFDRSPNAATITSIAGANRHTFISQALAEVTSARDRGIIIDGINIDFEYFGAVTPDARATFTAFMHDVAATFHGQKPGYAVSLAGYADSGASATLQDLTALDPYVDLFFIMAYDYNYPSSSNAGCVSPLTGNGGDNVLASLNGYLDAIAPDKLILGLPAYGYRWPTLDGAPNAVRDTARGTGRDVPYRAIEDAQRSRATPLTHDPDGCRWYATHERDGWYETYFDNSTTLGAKLSLVNSRHLRGAGLWALGMDDGYAALWSMITARLS